MQIPDQLLEGCRRADDQARQVLYKHCYVPMMRLALRYAYNEQDAADILNRAFFKVFTKIDAYQGTAENFGGWIRRIVVNEAIDLVRAQQAKRKWQILGETLPERKAPSTTESMIEEESILQLLQKLPRTTATVFNLFAMEGYAHKEISEMLGISESNSKWHLHSARKKLQTLLQKTATL